jgi:hypothetical protein
VRRGVVHVDDLQGVGVDEEDRLGRGVERRAEAAQLLLGAPPRADVAAGAAIAAERAGLVEHGLTAHAHIEPVAAGQAHGVLEIPERFAPLERRAVRVPFGGCRVDAGDLPAPLAEQGARVDTDAREDARRGPGEAQLLVLLPVPVGGQVGEAPEARFALAQAALGIEPVEAVADVLGRALDERHELGVEVIGLGGIQDEKPDRRARAPQRHAGDRGEAELTRAFVPGR